MSCHIPSYIVCCIFILVTVCSINCQLAVLSNRTCFRSVISSCDIFVFQSSGCVTFAIEITLLNIVVLRNLKSHFCYLTFCISCPPQGILLGNYINLVDHKGTQRGRLGSFSIFVKLYGFCLSYIVRPSNPYIYIY